MYQYDTFKAPAFPGLDLARARRACGGTIVGVAIEPVVNEVRESAGLASDASIARNFGSPPGFVLWVLQVVQACRPPDQADDRLRNIVLRADNTGRKVLLKDVGRAEPRY